MVATGIYGYDLISWKGFNCVLSCFVRRLLCSSDGCSNMLDEITGLDTDMRKSYEETIRSITSPPLPRLGLSSSRNNDCQRDF